MARVLQKVPDVVVAIHPHISEWLTHKYSTGGILIIKSTPSPATLPIAPERPSRYFLHSSNQKHYLFYYFFIIFIKFMGFWRKNKGFLEKIKVVLLEKMRFLEKIKVVLLKNKAYFEKKSDFS